MFGVGSFPKLLGPQKYGPGGAGLHAGPHGKGPQGAQSESNSDGTWDTESEVMELRAARDGL